MPEEDKEQEKPKSPEEEFTKPEERLMQSVLDQQPREVVLTEEENKEKTAQILGTKNPFKLDKEQRPVLNESEDAEVDEMP